MDGNRIEAEDALRILKEETPRRIKRLRRELQGLKKHLWERGLSPRETHRVEREEQLA
jgi:hypothetical protein